MCNALRVVYSQGAPLGKLKTAMLKKKTNNNTIVTDKSTIRKGFQFL